MSKDTAPPAPGFAVPAPNEAPPSYNQAIGVGAQATYHPHPPGGGVARAQPGFGVSVPVSQYQYQHQYSVPTVPVSPNMAPMQAITVVTTVVPPGPNSTHMVCPHCHAEIDSSVKTSPSMMAWLSGTLIALLGCWMGCCLIPCCIDECLDRDHYCPNCSAFLGRFQR